MTKEQLIKLVPNKTMVYSKSDGVEYTYIGIDKNGNHLLCGTPAYEEYLMLDCFEIRD